MHDYQRLYLSMACYNVSRRPALECDRHAIKIMRFYEPGDLTLANFVVAASPGPNKRCLVSRSPCWSRSRNGLVLNPPVVAVCAGLLKRCLMRERVVRKCSGIPEHFTDAVSCLTLTNFAGGSQLRAHGRYLVSEESWQGETLNLFFYQG